MSSTQKKPEHTRKTKAELQDELSEVRRLLKEKEDTLSNCSRDLKQAQKDLESAEELHQSLESMEAEIEEGRIAIKETSRMQNELSEAQHLLIDKQNELTLLQEQIGHLQEEIAATSDLKDSVKSVEKQLEKELKNQKVALDKKDKRITEQQKKIDAQEKRNREHQKEISKLKNVQSTLTGDNKSLSKKLKAVEKELVTSHEKLASIEQEKHELIEAAKHVEKDEKDTLPAAKSTFRIDVYPGQGHYQGRIEHLLSGDKKAFTEKEMGTLVEFINSHRPYLEDLPEDYVETLDLHQDELPASQEDINTANVQLDTITNQSNKEEDIQIPSHSEQDVIANDKEDSSALNGVTSEEKAPLESGFVDSAPTEHPEQAIHPSINVNRVPTQTPVHPSTNPQVRSFEVVSMQTAKRGKTLRNKHTFKTQLQFELPEDHELDTNPLRYEAFVYAKRLDNGRLRLLGSVRNVISRPDQLMADVSGVSLLPGTYRLELVTMFENTQGARASIPPIHHSELIHVL